METLSTSNNQSGYSTYFIGSTKNVTGCLDILIYTENIGSGIPIVSLNTLESVYNYLTDSANSEVALEISRENTEIPFEISEKSFNVIIYLSEVDKLPVGYTKFLNSQISPVDIYLDFKSHLSDPIEVSLVNSLAQVSSSQGQLRGDLIGNDELYKYRLSKDISEYIDSNKSTWISPFSNDLGDIRKNPNTLTSPQTTQLLTNESLGGLRLYNNINVDVYNLGLDKIQIGEYLEDLVIFSWKSGSPMYTITSLTKLNKFGTPFIYTKDYKNTSSLPAYLGNTVTEIDMFSGNYVRAFINNFSMVYDLSKQQWLEGDFIIDGWGNLPIELPETAVNLGQLQSVIPDLTNSIHSIVSGVNQIPTKRIGEWFVFEGTSGKIYSNISGELKLFESSADVFVLNNNVLISTSDYETYQISDHSETTTKTYEIKRKGDMYDSEFLLKFRKSENLPDEIPKIISSYRGMIFYLEDNYLNYL